MGERKQEFPNSSLLAIMVTGLQTNELSRKGSLLFIIPYMTLWKKKLNCFELKKKNSTEEDILYNHFKPD